MDKRMERFLASIGIEDAGSYDLRFVLTAHNPYNKSQIDMAIEKDSPWEYDKLDRFILALGNIRYPYSLRLGYSVDILIDDAFNLFKEWVLFKSVDPSLVEAMKIEGKTLTLHYESDSAKEANYRNVTDFKSLLSFINYEFDVEEVVDVKIEKEEPSAEISAPLEEESTLEEATIEAAEEPAIEEPKPIEKPRQAPFKKDEPPLTPEQEELDAFLNIDPPYMDIDESHRALGIKTAKEEIVEPEPADVVEEEVKEEEPPVEIEVDEPVVETASTEIVEEVEDDDSEEPEVEDLDDRDDEPEERVPDEVLSQMIEDSVPEEDPDDSGSSIQYGEEVLLEKRKEAAAWRKEQANRERVWSRGNYQAVHHIEELFQIKMCNVEFEGEIFQTRYSINKSGKAMNVFAVGDETNAINIRAFETKLLPVNLLKQIEPKKRCRIRGAIDVDKFSNSRIIVAHYVDFLPLENLRDDDEEEKRVELHLHTNMSTMDGVATFADYYRAARHMGMKAIGLCDHGSVQSFPAAQYAREDHIGYLKEHPDSDEKPLKILYGCEFYMFDPTIHCVINPKDIPLKGAKYCVFDTETTGLSSRYDEMIEFGAVIVENGSITKEWGTLIKPKMDLARAQRALAINKISEEELSSAPELDEVLPKIRQMLSGCILVAHNATFDIGVLNHILNERGLPPIDNPIIDTLPLSRYMFPKSGKHNEGALLKNLGLRNYEDESAHRAVYDARALSEGWLEMLRHLGSENPDILHSDLAAFSVQKPTKSEDMTTEEYNEAKDSYYRFCRAFHPYHITAYAKNKQGVADLFEIVSKSETEYLSRVPRTPRFLLEEKRENLLIGSSCFNGEIFEIASTREQKDLVKAMEFYDFIEIQPLENYSFLINVGDVYDKEHLITLLRDIINAAKEAGKMVVATGDAHYINPEDKIYRDVFIHSLGIGNGRHDLNPYKRDEMERFDNPDQHFRTTGEMLESFRQWLPEEEAFEYVVTNSNAIADLIDDGIEIVSKKTFTPNANLPDSEEKIRSLCEGNFHKNYDYLYGDDDPEVLAAIQTAKERMERELKGIIGSGYAVTYYIAHRLIKLANSEPERFIVGSRGSVGSSFAATMAEITEVNPLPAHYHCPKCHYLHFEDAIKYRSGFDLPDKNCPKCGTKLETNGQNIPFETFLGFHADKVPDIDLNFEDESQHRAHNYCRDLLGENNVYRAGTIETVAEKTAFGYVRGYFEKMGKDPESISTLYIAYLASHCQGVKRTTGQHPGGIVVIPSDHSVYEFTPVQFPADDLSADWLTTHFDFHALHDEVLKLDILGHVDPMAMRYYRDLTGIDIEKIPLNDPKVLSLFSSPKELKMHSNYLGVENGATALPEFGTALGMQMLSAIKPKCFNDLIIIAGLAHGTNVWAGNAEELVKQGKSINEIIGCRDEIMTYLISMGLPSSNAFNIMERVRKGKRLTAAQENEMRAHNVPDFYIASCNKIEYLFPRGHATAYVTMAVRVAYFKLYYPLEFYAVFFSVRSDDWDIQSMVAGEEAVKAKIEEFKARQYDKTNALSSKEKNQYKTLLVALEMLERGYIFLNINLYRSDSKMFVCDHEHKALIPPFIVVDQLGENVAKSIIEARQQTDMDGKPKPFISKKDLQDRTRLSTTLIKKLDELGVLEGMGETNQPSLFDFA